MKVLSWNCRGLGNPWTFQTLCRLVRTKKPSLVFLMETKQVCKTLESVRVKLGFEAIFVVDSIGRSGGLALLWNSETKVEVQNLVEDILMPLSTMLKLANHGNSWVSMEIRKLLEDQSLRLSSVFCPKLILIRGYVLETLMKLST
jgi:exonuclease III